MTKLFWIFGLGCFFFFACKSEEPKEPEAIAGEASAELEEGVVPTFPAYCTIPYLMGKFDPSSDSNFVVVPTAMANRNNHYLRKETLEAFKRMHEAAKLDGISLKVISATRNFKAQKRIWEAKWNGGRLVDGQNLARTISDPATRALKILEYSSMPGTSRHHWGSDLDINNLNNSYFESGKGLEVYQWLIRHAAEYGFCQTYTAKDSLRPNGYQEEKWHWSYLPVAQPLTEFAKTNLLNDSIQGFDGAETAKLIGVVEKYVLGINEACQEKTSH